MPQLLLLSKTMYGCRTAFLGNLSRWCVPAPSSPLPLSLGRQLRLHHLQQLQPYAYVTVLCYTALYYRDWSVNDADFTDEGGKGPTRFIYCMCQQTKPKNATTGQ